MVQAPLLGAFKIYLALQETEITAMHMRVRCFYYPTDVVKCHTTLSSSKLTILPLRVL